MSIQQALWFVHQTSRWISEIVVVYQSTKTNKWNKKAISKVNGIGDINTVDFRMIYIKWKLHVIKFGVQNKREIADNIRLIFVKIQWQAYQTFAWLLPLFLLRFE